MRAMNLIGFFLAVFFSLTALADSTPPAPGERALREECSAFSEAGMRQCLADKAERSQKALQQAESQMLSALSSWDEDGKYIHRARIRFLTSNQAFAKYREAQCAFASSLGGGAIGNGLEIRRLACVAELNDRRAVLLRDAVSDFSPR